MKDSREGMGRRIAELRDRKGWTQKQLAQKAELSAPFLSDIERGKRSVGAEILLRIATELRASLDYIMVGEDNDDTSTPSRSTLNVPPALEEAAQSKNWSYTETMAVLEAHEAIMARRGGVTSDYKPTTERCSDEWIDFHRRIFDE